MFSMVPEKIGSGPAFVPLGLAKGHPEEEDQGMQQDIELLLPDGSIARFLFNGPSCWIEVRMVDDEFAPSRTTFTDGLSSAVGQAMVDRALKGAPMFEPCGHPATSCRCAAHAQIQAAQAKRKPKYARILPEAQYVAGAVENGFGASPVPMPDIDWASALSSPLGTAGGLAMAWSAGAVREMGPRSVRR
jgi:hypothetical protein